MLFLVELLRFFLKKKIELDSIYLFFIVVVRLMHISVDCCITRYIVHTSKVQPQECSLFVGPHWLRAKNILKTINTNRKFVIQVN